MEEDGMVEVGMGETEPLLVSVLGSVSWRGFSDCSILCRTLLLITRLWLRPCSSRTYHLVLV
jgi:hypothetical protein